MQASIIYIMAWAGYLYILFGALALWTRKEWYIAVGLVLFLIVAVIPGGLWNKHQDNEALVTQAFEERFEGRLLDGSWNRNEGGYFQWVDESSVWHEIRVVLTDKETMLESK